MQTSEQTYLIPLKNLDFGKHEFQLKIDNSFFTEIEDSEILGGTIIADLKIVKSEFSSKMNLVMNGKVDVLCDRCLSNLSYEIETEDDFIIKEGDEYLEDENNIIYLPQNDDLDVSWIIYETLVLSLPVKRVHDEGDCDESMIDSINEFSVEDSDKQEKTDPRWDGLKQLLNNNNN